MRQLLLACCILSVGTMGVYDLRAQRLAPVLATDAAAVVSAAEQEDSWMAPRFCQADAVARSPDHKKLYAWVACMWYYPERIVGGSSGPVLAHVEGTRVISLEHPQDGGGYSADIERMFPRRIARQFLDRRFALEGEPAEVRARRAGFTYGETGSP